MISVSDQQLVQQEEIGGKIVRGAIAGFISTFPMTLVIQYLQEHLPIWQQYNLPPGQITQKLIEHKLLRRPAVKGVKKWQHRVLTFFMHFGYGATMGSMYEVLFTSKADKLSAAGQLGRSMLVGVIAWTANYLGLLPGLHILPPATKTPARRNIVMFVGHLVWSSVLVMISNALHRSAGQR
jgi:uncharacterized membrane protein YagU involved in acid resistance